MSRGFLVAVMLAVGASGQPVPSPVWPDDVALKTQWPEAKQPRAMVVPPGTQGCTAGRVIVSAGLWNADPEAKFMRLGTPLRMPILLAADLRSSAAEEIALPRVPTGHAVTDDHQLFRLADGTLAVLWTIALNSEPRDAESEMWKDVRNGVVNGFRGAIALWTAKDACGREWNEPQVLLDSLATKIDGILGSCAAPQYDRSWIGGYVSTTAAADPWDPTKIYLAGRCEASREFYRQFVTTLTRGADGKWSGSELRSIKAKPPMDMTVAPKTDRRERVYIASCIEENNVPRTKIGWLDYGKIIGGPVNASRGCDSIEGLKFFPSGPIQSLSKANGDRHSDLLRLVHPSVVEGRQVAVASLLRVAHIGSIKLERQMTIDAGAGKHIVGANFVEADEKDDGALLYWLEHAPGNKITARGMFFHGDTAGKPFTLSMRQGKPATATLVPTDVLGNWMSGAFYREGDKPRYLAVWAQRDVEGRVRVHYNVYAP